MFETEKEVLGWYESLPRAVTAEFINSIDWSEVRKHQLSAALVPVLVYMRDVESFTEIYYREMSRTPTGRDPIIKKFMERWGVEESDHGELLNRFLDEAGFTTGAKWRAAAASTIPWKYTAEGYVASIVAQCFGRSFAATHMVWGAVNELTTLQGYRRLWQLANHPVLEQILRAIAREESAHVRFYWNIARLKMQRSKVARKTARFAVDHFWTPVGEGAKPRREIDYLIATLFGGERGLEFFERNVSRRVRMLPGFASSDTVTARVKQALIESVPHANRINEP